MEAPRIRPQEAKEKVQHGEAILVCAYEDEEKCSKMHLEGAIHMQELEEKLPELDKEQEIIFYCG
jgi:rhodanese-related sulfurtransferase